MLLSTIRFEFHLNVACMQSYGVHCVQVTIGRLPGNVITIASDYVSGEHARISWCNGKKRWVLVSRLFT